MLSILFKISIIFLLLSLLQFKNFEHPLIIVSIFYSLFLFIWKERKETFKNSPGITVLAVGMFFRYALLPLSYYTFGGYNLYTPDYFDEAIVIMLFEQIILFLLILTTSRGNNGNLTGCISCVKINPSIWSFSICIALMLYSYGSTSITIGFDTIGSGNLNDFYENELTEQTFTSQLQNFIWTSTYLVLYILILYKLKYLYEKKNNNLYIISAVLITLVLGLITFLNQSGGHLARWQTIVFTISGVFLVLALFPKKRKYILLTIGIPFVTFMLIATAVKNGGYMSTTGGSFSDAMNMTFGPESLDSYLDGPDGISSAIKLKETSDLWIESLFHDSIHQIPILHKYEDFALLTSKRYHLIVGKSGFIIPLTGQSMIYFGYILAPLLSSIAFFILRKMDLKFKTCDTLFSYVYAFGGCWMAIGMVFLNYTIMNAWLFTYFIPLMILLYIVSKLGCKNRNKNTKY